MLNMFIPATAITYCDPVLNLINKYPSCRYPEFWINVLERLEKQEKEFVKIKKEEKNDQNLWGMLLV